MPRAPRKLLSTTDRRFLEAEFIDLVATAGLLIDEDGKVTKFSQGDLAKKYNMHRVTVTNLKHHIPDFWEKVRERRRELYGQTHMSLIYRAMFKKAMAGDVQAAKLIMNQARELEPEKSVNQNENVDTVKISFEGLTAEGVDDATSGEAGADVASDAVQASLETEGTSSTSSTV